MNYYVGKSKHFVNRDLDEKEACTCITNSLVRILWITISHKNCFATLLRALNDIQMLFRHQQSQNNSIKNCICIQRHIFTTHSNLN